jgi:hypothetical protein
MNIAYFDSSLKPSAGKKRSGPVLFPGDYKERGKYCLVDIERICATFSACDMNIEHIHKTPLSGKLGRWVRAFIKDGALHAEIECPEPLSQLLGDGPTPVSCEIDMKNMKAVGLAWTSTPFFEQASLASFSSAVENAYACFSQGKPVVPLVETTAEMSARIAAEIIASRIKAAGGI